MTKEKTLKEHLRDAVRVRWAKTTPEERSAYGKMMAAKKKEKREAATSTGEKRELE